VNPRDVDPEARRLVDAAWRVLERTNFEGFKVERVIHEADVSTRTFYRYFADKDELLLALLRDEMARAATRLRATVDAEHEPAAMVSVWIRSVIGAAADPRRTARAKLFSAQQPLLRRFPTDVDEATLHLVEPLRDALILGARSGVFPWAEPERDALAIYALTGAAMSDALSDRPGEDIGETADRTTSFVLRALGVPPEQRSG
jgi:AcrR family transcriptional regulator